MSRILNYGNDYKSRDEMANKPKSRVDGNKSGSKPEKKGEGKAEEETGKKEKGK